MRKVLPPMESIPFHEAFWARKREIGSLPSGRFSFSPRVMVLLPDGMHLGDVRRMTGDLLWYTLTSIRQEEEA